MYVAPGVPTGIRPEDVVRAEDESDEAYAERQALMLELWSIPHDAREPDRASTSRTRA
jgi:hypothetical protein